MFMCKLRYRATNKTAPGGIEFSAKLVTLPTKAYTGKSKTNSTSSRDRTQDKRDKLSPELQIETFTTVEINEPRPLFSVIIQ